MDKEENIQTVNHHVKSINLVRKCKLKKMKYYNYILNRLASQFKMICTAGKNPRESILH